MDNRLLCDLIQYYFFEGLYYDEILGFLTMRHNISISFRTLKRILKRHRLFRRKHFINFNSVIEFLREQVESSGQLHGFRWMHLRCIRSGFTVTRNTIRLALQFLDPHGVNIRRRRRLRRRQYSNKGPNFLWHLDSYDKLKSYGITINGCIDEFSRYIIWLKALATNSDPKVMEFTHDQKIKKPHFSSWYTNDNVSFAPLVSIRKLFSKDKRQASLRTVQGRV